jgi:peptidoglycan/xylan/chitin deacetylase (PgdA/CDA1 family)
MLFCYHAVSDEWPERFAVSTVRLEEQVRYLIGRGYRAATFSEAVAGSDERAFAVTFDDGFRSVHDRAFPVLSDLGVPATVFVCTALVNSQGPHPLGYERWRDTPYREELMLASWEEIARLADSGWEIGSHTRSHPHLTRVDDESLRDELRGSREDIELRLGRPCRSVAYPFAEVDSSVVQAAAAAGYVAGATVFGSFHAARDPLRQPRVVVNRRDGLSRFRLKAMPTYQAVGASRPVRAIRRTIRL